MLDQTTECSKVAPLLDAFHDGELSNEEKDAVATHLRSCEACQARLHEIEKLVVSLHGLPRLEMPHTLQLDWKALVERQADSEKTAPDSQPAVVKKEEDKVIPFAPALKRRRAIAAVAAGLVVLAGAAAIISQNPMPSPAPSVADKPVLPGQNGSAQEHVAAPLIAAKENDGSKPGPAAGDSQAVKNAGNGELIALYSADSNLVSEDIGIATDEDGLYALKL